MKLTKLPHTRLAEGEVTGHFHEAIGPDIALWSSPSGKILLNAPQGTTVRHQEHGPLVLPPGDYDRTIVQEYDHFAEEARSVAD